ncbi:MAG TPA: zinc ribbon domain-containing protein [Terriglobales bacterium]|nr:zinc ribbon domain-containing protein [Terriglobales bacterium]
MFCDSCGAQVAATQRFCGTCGKPLGMVVAGRVSTRVADHRQMLGILWVIYAFFHVILAGILFVLSNTLFVHLAERASRNPNGPPLTFLTPLIMFVSILVLAKGLLAAAGGIGLLQKQHWARLICLVSAFLALFSIPIGTALGIYTIWVLMSRNAEEDYSKLTAANA